MNPGEAEKMKNAILKGLVLSLTLSVMAFGQDMMRRQEPTMKPVPTMKPMMKKTAPRALTVKKKRKPMKKYRKATAERVRAAK